MPFQFGYFKFRLSKPSLLQTIAQNTYLRKVAGKIEAGSYKMFVMNSLL